MAGQAVARQLMRDTLSHYGWRTEKNGQGEGRLRTPAGLYLFLAKKSARIPENKKKQIFK